MRWPFISRETLDRTVALYERLLAEKDAAHALVVNVLRPPAPMAPPAPPVPVKRELTKVEHAINLRAGESRPHRRYLQTWAAQAKAEGMDEDEIVLRIVQGDQVSDDEAVETDA